MSVHDCKVCLLLLNSFLSSMLCGAQASFPVPFSQEHCFRLQVQPQDTQVATLLCSTSRATSSSSSSINHVCQSIEGLAELYPVLHERGQHTPAPAPALLQKPHQARQGWVCGEA